MTEGTLERLERAQIAKGGFANWPRDYAAEARAEQSIDDHPGCCMPSRRYPGPRDEYLENERRYPVSDMWEREDETIRKLEESTEPIG